MNPQQVRSDAAHSPGKRVEPGVATERGASDGNLKTVDSTEETEGATGALETPATPPDMSKTGKVEPNKAGKP
jgi:hypothetical protein